jgi:hypothetical protein
MPRKSPDIRTFGPELDRAKQHDLLLTEIEQFERWLAQLTALVEQELPQSEFVPRWLAGLKQWTLERKRAQSRLNWKWNAQRRSGDLVARDLRRMGPKLERAREKIAEARRQLSEREEQVRALAGGTRSASSLQEFAKGVRIADTPSAVETRIGAGGKGMQNSHTSPTAMGSAMPTSSGDGRTNISSSDVGSARDTARNPSKLNPTSRMLIERDLDIDVMTTSDEEIIRGYMLACDLTREQAQLYVDGLHNWPPTA